MNNLIAGESGEDIPWVSYLALSFLDSMLVSFDTDTSIFEYGSGGSTVYFSQFSKNVVSVEHDQEWYNEVNAKISDNVDYHFVPYEIGAIGDDKSNPYHYTSNPFMANFQSYVSVIDNYDLFDIIFIDGRSRASCLMHASSRIKSGGWIILDNTERDYYLKNTAHLFEGWETAKFFGHGPHITWPWETLFMRRP